MAVRKPSYHHVTQSSGAVCCARALLVTCATRTTCSSALCSVHADFAKTIQNSDGYCVSCSLRWTWPQTAGLVAETRWNAHGLHNMAQLCKPKLGSSEHISPVSSKKTFVSHIFGRWPGFCIDVSHTKGEMTCTIAMKLCFLPF